MTHRRFWALLLLCPVLLWLVSGAVCAQSLLQTPEQFLGFRVGEDKKIARWDKIVAYLRLVDSASDRVSLRELGKTTQGNPFILAEISAPETLKNLDRFP